MRSLRACRRLIHCVGCRAMIAGISDAFDRTPDCVIKSSQLM